MAAVPQLWQSAIRVLQDLPDSRLQGTSCNNGANTGHLAPLAEAWYRIQRANEGQVLPEATWKKLIKDKVPYRLAAACLKVLSNRQLAASFPPGPMGQSIGMTNEEYAISLLVELVSQAAADCSLGNTSGSSKLKASLAQQLQQSGFLDILPQVLTDAADSLHATAATEAAVRGEPYQCDDAAQSGDRGHGEAGTGSAAGSTSTASTAGASSSSSREACGTSSASRRGNSTQMHPEETRLPRTHAAISVLELFIRIDSCWPAGHAFVSQVAPACIAPTVRLAVAVIQHVSQQLSSTTAHEPSRLEHHAEAWRAASEAAALVLTGLRLEIHSLAKAADPMTSITSRYTARLPLHLEALINSPHLLPCLCLMMATSAYSALLLQLPALPSASTQSGQYCGSNSSTATGYAPDAPRTSESDGNSSSSSSRKKKKGRSSKSSGGNRQSDDAAPPTMASLISNPMQAWQFACSQHHLLPGSHDKLLHLLGSSSKVLLWAAAAAAGHAIKKLSSHSMQPNDGASQLLQPASRVYDARLVESVTVYQSLAVRQGHDWLAGRLAVQELQDLKAELLCALDSSSEQLAASLGVAATEQDRRWPHEQQLHYLIPTIVLYYWAVNQPATMATSPSFEIHAHVLRSSGLVLEVVLVGPETKLERGKLLISQLSKQLSDDEQQRLQAVLQHGASATPPACHVPRDVQVLVHQELLPLAAQAARQLLAQADSKLAGSSTGTTASGGSRHSSTGSMQPTAVFSRDVCESAWAIIKLLSNLNGHSVDTAAQQVSTQGRQADGTAMQGSSTAAVQSVTPALQPWAPHAGLFCQLMELGLRCSEDVPNLSDSIALLACQGGRGGPTGPVMGSLGPLLIQASAAKPGSLAAPSSPQQLQLVSLVCSLIKCMQTPGGQKQDTAVLCRGLFSFMVPVIQLELTEQGGPAAAAEQSTLPAADSAGMPVAWLVLLGRCCLLLAGLLKSALAADRPSTAVPALQQAMVGAAVQLPSVLINTLLYCATSISSAQDWLQLSSTSAQLTAAGYSPKNLLQQLQSTAAAVQGADAADGLKTVPRGWVQAAAQALKALGVTLNTLAIPHACNNPRCSNLSGPSELQLVGGCSATCAGCLTGRYCSKLCQRAHWKQHKPVCKALAAAAAAASTGGTSAAD